ncbi:MAG: amino acid permease [Chlamydiae bacterium]|nr:amino acid permease [Chlamydiota bacterium]
MRKSLFIKKSMHSLQSEAAQKQHTFTRTLGALNLTTIGIGAIIGAGLFVLTGQVAAEYAGPGILFSFLIAGMISVFAALCYAEFAALIPISGSAYSYAYFTMGEFPAWVIGWGMTLQYLLSACTVSVGWSSYFTSLLGDFGLHIPTWLSTPPLIHDAQSGWHFSGALLNLPAMCIVAIMGCVIATGIKAAASFNNVMVFLKLAVVVLFIACGVGYINLDNLSPFIPENTGVFGQYGWSGILRGAGLLFFAFIGFDALSTLTQEAKNPQKDMPRGMLGSLGLCTLVYLLFAVVLLGLVSYKFLGVADPIAVAVNVLGPSFLWLRLFVKVAILAGFTSVIMVMMMGQSRIFYTMAHDGLLPKVLGRINDATHVPVLTTALVTLVGVVVAGLFPVGVIGSLVAMATLMAFSFVCFAVLLLHYKQPHLHRPFRTPGMPWVPLIGTIVCLAQMALFPLITWVQLITWLLIGCVVYFTYGIRRSKLRKAG